MIRDFYESLAFYTKDRKSLTNEIIEDIKRKEKKFVVTANPEIIVNALKRNKYDSIIRNANYVIADGIGIIFAAKLLKKNLPTHVPGIELMEDLLNRAVDLKLNVYLLGSTEPILHRAVKNIEEKYKGIKICGYHHGYFRNVESVISDIKKAKPDIVFVALGSPIQEEFISDHLSLFEKGIFIGVGGSIDVLSGYTKRAPLLMRKLSLEWAYRILTHPRRIKKVNTLFYFVITVFIVKLASILLLSQFLSKKQEEVIDSSK
ncbi:WecB/TagA/CpsF family glycosyltransferase [Fredinandcohnia humi]